MGSKLRVWRRQERLTLEDVAALTGYTAAMLSFVETGKRRLSRRGKVLISRRLGVPLKKLFDPIQVRASPRITKSKRPLAVEALQGGNNR